ncbi:MAG: cytochrome C biogenesis protein, partial [Flavobacteriales bacterium]|nr:cytochrome C biogenesis protein [Flavobacteriales bacterium]
MKISTLLFIALAPMVAMAQQPGQPAAQDPVKWSISSVKQGPGEWDLVFTAKADPGWYIYS